MQLIAIVFLFLFLIVHSVSCFQTEKINNDGIKAKKSHVVQSNQIIDSTSEFYNKLEELFQAFNQNDTEQMEHIFKALETINPNQMNELLDTNSTNNYARRFHNYVVS